MPIEHIEGMPAGAIHIGKMQPVATNHVVGVSTKSRPQLILDIGTHKVLGLVTCSTEKGLEVLASCFVAHPAGAMRDGQIHDVPAVARTLRLVVRELEADVNVTFTEAYIAAAGRALRTSRGKAEETHEQPIIISEASKRLVEWEAVADAQTRLLEALPDAEQTKGYYCIAHSQIGSWLDNELMGSLIGQRGREFSVEVLATFLPGAVVDSLEAVLTEAGLEMRGLTLEPIAALEAVIPATMRHLDLTLVDVGAGTSDIAVTGDGTVQAFAMVPQAGDVITEAVSRAFLLDFGVAEQVKRTVSMGESIRVENVLGDIVEVDLASLQTAIRDTTHALAERIVAEIAVWSPEAPQALLLVGGGSRTPGLAEHLAQLLDLPSSRVAVRDRRAVRNVVGEEQLEGPDAVTALGIALRSVYSEQPPVRVRVNGRPVCLFLPDRCTVREAARIVGMPMTDIVGRLGAGITVTVNGEVVVIPGTKGAEAEVLVNGASASFDTHLKTQDEVDLTPPTPGRPPELVVGDLIERWLAQHQEARTEGRLPYIQLDGEWLQVPVWVRCNGDKAHPDDPVDDRAVYEMRLPRTAAELWEAAGRAAPAFIHCWVNGRRVELQAGGTWMRNGQPARQTDPVQDGDVWDWQFAEPMTVQKVLKDVGAEHEGIMRIVLNGKSTSVPLPAAMRRNGQLAQPGDRVHGGDRLDISAEKAVPLYQILPHIGVTREANDDLRKLELRVRGEPAGFTTVVAEGDEVTISYK